LGRPIRDDAPPASTAAGIGTFISKMLANAGDPPIRRRE